MNSKYHNPLDYIDDLTSHNWLKGHAENGWGRRCILIHLGNAIPKDFSGDVSVFYGLSQSEIRKLIAVNDNPHSTLKELKDFLHKIVDKDFRGRWR